MTDDDRKLARRLFVTAMAMLEDAIEIAVAGQSSKRQARELVELAQRLEAAARDISMITQAAAVVAKART